MKRWLLILALGVLIVKSSNSEQIMPNLQMTYRLLEEKFLYSLQELSLLNEQVASLEIALTEARQSSETSEGKILDLEKSLNEALKQQEVLENTVKILKTQLGNLSILLKASEAVVIEQGDDLAALQKDVARFSRMVGLQRYFIVGLAVIAVVEAIIIVARK